MIDKRLKSIVRGYGDLFFTDNLIASCVILLCSFINFNIGLSGLISLVSAYIFTRIIQAPATLLWSKAQVYNALLIGFSIGSLFSFNEVTAGIVVVASLLSVIITMTLESISTTYLGLPIFSLPFVIVSSIIYLAAPRYSNLIVNGLYPHSHFVDAVSFPPLIAGYLKSLGCIIFLPYVVPGLIIAALILFNSRILFLLGLIGYIWGVSVQGLFIGNVAQAIQESVGFNYILIAMSVGGVFLVPSIASSVIALLAVATATVLISAADTFWAQYGLPIFTLPFIGITTHFIYILRFVQYKGRPTVNKQTPEETQEYFVSSSERIRQFPHGFSAGPDAPLSFHHWAPYYSGGVMEFDGFIDGLPVGTVVITVGQSVDGILYFQCNNAKLYFGVWDQWMTTYHMDGWDPYLAALFLAWPKMPLVASVHTRWNDVLYSSGILSPTKRWICKNFHWIFSPLFRIVGNYELTSSEVISGWVKNKFLGIVYDTQIQFEYLTISLIRSGNVILKKKDNPK